MRTQGVSLRKVQEQAEVALPLVSLRTVPGSLGRTWAGAEAAGVRTGSLGN